MEGRKIILTESQFEMLGDVLNDELLDGVTVSFSIDTLRSMDWKDGSEIALWCEKCSLLCIGEGGNRKVFQIDDDRVIKIEKKNTMFSQNDREVENFRKCDDDMRQLVPGVLDWDKKNLRPLWVICEQVLPASYADFRKVLGIDFGDYRSSADIDQMNSDLGTYSKYENASTMNEKITLTGFLDAFDEGNVEYCSDAVRENQWFSTLYKMLKRGIVDNWELTVIENWGLVNRGGKPTLVILDLGI